MRLEVRDLSWHSAAARIVDEVSLHAESGELVGLIGPNGSGKSSLLRMIYRVLRPLAGTATVDGDDIWHLSARDNARRMAVLAQDNTGDFAFNVDEVVAMGRNPHKRVFDGDNATDRAVVEQALARVGAAHLATRDFASLSGGEKQRVLIARALAQQARMLVLDEPTNHLDVRYQFEIMRLIRGLGVTTVIALHDLNLAAHYCDRLYLIDGGRIAAAGPPADVLTPECLRAVYHVRAEVSRHPANGKPRIDFLPDE